MFAVGDKVKAVVALSVPSQPDYVPVGTEGVVTDVTKVPYPVTVEFDGIDVSWFVSLREIVKLDS